MGLSLAARTLFGVSLVLAACATVPRNFRLEPGERWIDIFDCAFDADDHAFVGDPARPLQPSVRVILHEIGHAISLARLGQLGFEAMRVSLGEMNEAMANARAALAPTQNGEFETPVLRSFLALPGARSGFTPYGRTNPTESFAEAFSLFRADPDACRRISPEVFGFFASGAHLPAATGG
jgi:hypothetical protein